MKETTEYVVVSDKSGKVLLFTTDLFEAMKLANKIRSAGGYCTIFKSTNH